MLTVKERWLKELCILWGSVRIYTWIFNICIHIHEYLFPGGSDGKESACNAGDQGLIPGLGGSSEEGNGYPLQYSCLENSMDRGAWWAIVSGVAGSDMAEQLPVYAICYIAI